MIQPQTRLKVADNTGAKEIMCFRVMGGSFRQTGSVGEFLMASVKSATPGGGVKKGDAVSIVSRTRWEWPALDMAIMAVGALTVPVYETISDAQVSWIFNDSQATIAFAEDDGQRDKIESIHDEVQSLRKVFVIEAGALEALQANGKEVRDEEFWARKNDAHGDDLATIVYTSGSTGTPKGVELSHRNLAFLCLSAMQYMPRACAWPDRRLLLFLPLSHVFARFMELLRFCGTLTLGLSSDLKTIVKDFESFGPTLLLAVPRVFEKVYNAASQRAGKGIAGKMFLRAADVAREGSQAEQAGENLPSRGRLALGFYGLVQYKKIRTIFSPNADFAITGGAPMDANLSHFFNGIGMPGLEGYGMTETCGAISGAVAIMGFVMSAGMENPKTKGQTYKLSREIAKRFGDKNTTTICGTLKGIGPNQGPLRSCPGCIDDAIEIACDVLKQLAE